MRIFEQTNNDMAGVYVIYESPSRNEDITTAGISHLLEHMISKATDDIEEEYDDNCLNTNAFTSNENVIFVMTGLSEKIEKYKDDYIKRITTYQPTQKDFDIEHPIVTQEYCDSFSDPSYSTYANFLSKYFGVMLPVGTRSALEGMTYEKTIEFKNKYFANPTKIVIVDKNDSVIEEIKYESTIPQNENKIYEINKDLVPNDKSLGFVFSSPVIKENKKSYMIRFIGSMLSHGLKSPLYQSLREEKGLVYGVGAFQFDVFNDDVMLIYMSSALENKDVIKSSVMEILSQPEKYMTRERFNLIYNNKTIQKKVKDQFKFENAHIKYLDAERESKSLFKNIETLTYEDVMEFYNTHLHPDKNEWLFENQKDLIG